MGGIDTNFSASRLAEQLFGELALNRNSHFYVAFSGGIDSTVLLYLMQEIRTRIQSTIHLTALHVDHGLQTESARWSEHCEKACLAMGVRLVKTRLSLAANSEASAREARYKWFSEQIEPNSILLTAHHRQDRAETVLFNLLRGAGSAGLSSLRMVRPFYRAQLVRPLMGASKEEIEGYAQAHSLNWIEDPSNQQTDYSRNKIRHEVLPALTAFRPDAIQNIARAASNLEQENGLLREVAICDLVDVREHPKHPLDSSHALCFEDLEHLSYARRANLLRFWLYSLQLHTPSRRLLNELLEAIDNPPSSTAVVQENGTQFRFYRGYLYVMPSIEEAQVFPTIDWQNVNQPIDLYQRKIRVDATRKLRELLNSQRQTGVRLAAKPHVVNPKALQGHSLNLKKWLQEIGIPPWRRQALPLLTMPRSGSDVVLGPVDQQLQSDWVLLECPVN